MDKKNASHRIYQLNIIPFLRALGVKTLDEIPDFVLYSLKFKWKIDYLYLLSIWERSKIPLDRHNPGTKFLFGENGDCTDKPWKVSDVITSGFSIKSYSPDERVANDGFDEVRRLKKRLNSIGIQLILDFVPNHTSWDFSWIRRKPSFYIHSSPDIIHPGAENDGVIWGDTAQLNYMDKEMRSHMLETIHIISDYCDGLRCDMAHCVMNDVFLNQWRIKIEQFSSGNPHNYKLEKAEFIPEFWTQAREIVGKDFLLMAEAYHGHEAELIGQGFDAVYDKEGGFYDNLLTHLTTTWQTGGNGDIMNYVSRTSRQMITNYKGENSVYSNHLVRYIENHDEERAACLFGENLIHAIRILSDQYSSPSRFTMLHNGQASGLKIRTPIQLSRFVPEEPDLEILNLYEEVFGADLDWMKKVEINQRESSRTQHLLKILPEFR